MKSRGRIQTQIFDLQVYYPASTLEVIKLSFSFFFKA